MKAKLFTIAAAAGLLAAGMASAQTSNTTVDDIVCKMSNTCDASGKPSDADRQKVGDEKMFSLQKAQPAGDAGTAGQKVGDEKMFSLQTGASATPAPAGGQPTYYKASSTTRVSKSKHKKAVTYAEAPSSPASSAPAAPSADMTMQVRFELGSAELTDDTKGELTKYVEAMQRPELASMKFTIEGHTDSTGRRATNMDLSQRRAQSVVDYLVSNGVASDRLVAKGYGPDKPLTGMSRSSPLNRRVELVRAD